MLGVGTEIQQLEIQIYMLVYALGVLNLSHNRTEQNRTEQNRTEQNRT